MKFGAITTDQNNQDRAKNIERSEFEERVTDDEQDLDNIENDEAQQTMPIQSAKAITWIPARTTVASSTSHKLDDEHAILKHGSSQSAIAGKPRQNGAGMPSITKQSNIQSSNVVAKQIFDAVDDSSDSEVEAEGDGATLDLTDNAAIAKALFAGDETVERNFDKEKRKTIEDEGDRFIDNTLPGWGSWTGYGISKKEQRRKKGRLLTVVKGVPEEKRKDAKLERVIINEKTIKKNGKYLANELPHPFESRQQYERSLRLPIGPEWTTKSTFQDATKPRVLMKQGVIRPIARPMA